MKLFLSHQLYGKRPNGHRDMHHVEPGWLFIEAGDWTLEVDYTPTNWRRAAVWMAGRIARPVLPVVGGLLHSIT